MNRIAERLHSVLNERRYAYDLQFISDDGEVIKPSLPLQENTRDILIDDYFHRPGIDLTVILKGNGFEFIFYNQDEAALTENELDELLDHICDEINRSDYLRNKHLKIKLVKL